MRGAGQGVAGKHGHQHPIFAHRRGRPGRQPRSRCRPAESGSWCCAWPCLRGRQERAGTAVRVERPPGSPIALPALPDDVPGTSADAAAARTTTALRATGLARRVGLLQAFCIAAAIVTKLPAGVNVHFGGTASAIGRGGWGRGAAGAKPPISRPGRHAAECALLCMTQSKASSHLGGVCTALEG